MLIYIARSSHWMTTQTKYYPVCLYFVLNSSISRWNFSISSRMLLESLLPSPSFPPAMFSSRPSFFSLSSIGEYKAYSFPPFSSAGAYSLLNELSLATLVRLCSVLVRRYSVLVRRLSVGDEEET